MAKDDEYFRLAVSSMIDRSESGNEIWDNRIVQSTVTSRRIGSLVDEVLDEAFFLDINTPYGLLPATGLTFHCEPINRCLIRIAKGFLYLTHPEVESHRLSYEVTMMKQFTAPVVAKFLNDTGFAYFELGSGVFRMWRGFLDTDLRHGTWYFLFYDSAGFVVVQSPAK